MFALMGGLFVYVDNTPSLQKAQIELYEVELLSVNTEENSAELSVCVMIREPSDTTFTVPSIASDLYAFCSAFGVLVHTLLRIYQ